MKPILVVLLTVTIAILWSSPTEQKRGVYIVEQMDCATEVKQLAELKIRLEDCPDWQREIILFEIEQVEEYLDEECS